MPSSQHRPTFPTLFSPTRIGPMRARNRVMRVAITSNLAERNRAGERMLAFYRTVAQARFGPSDASLPGLSMGRFTLTIRRGRSAALH